MLWFAAAIALSALAGWRGRYDYPVVTTLVVGGLAALVGEAPLPRSGLDAAGIGLLVAYLRRPIVHPDWPRLPF